MSIIAFEPPKAHNNKLTRDHFWAEPKLDGVRAIVHLHPEEGIVITTRRLNKDGIYTRLQDKLPQFRDDPILNEIAAAGYTILDGELIFPGKKAQDIMSVVGAKPPTAIGLQQAHGWAKLALFDIAYYGGIDVRRNSLQGRKELLTELHSRYQPPAFLVAHTDLNLRPGTLEAERALFMDRCLEAGYEGMVLKNPFAPYTSTQWRKLKAMEAVDLVVAGITPGLGKYSGQIGALAMQWPDGTFACNVAPGSDADRAWLTDRLWGKSPAEIRALDWWVEVECQEVTRDRSLRHPRIKRWRPDLSSATKEDTK